MKKTVVKIMACSALLLTLGVAKPAMAWEDSSDRYDFVEDFTNREEGRYEDGRVYTDTITGNRVIERWNDGIPQTPFIVRNDNEIAEEVPEVMNFFDFLNDQDDENMDSVGSDVIPSDEEIF